MDFIILYPKNKINTICIYLTNVTFKKKKIFYSNCKLYATNAYRLPPKLFENITIVNSNFEKFMPKICTKNTTIIGGISNLETIKTFVAQYKCKSYLYKDMLGESGSGGGGCYGYEELVKKMLGKYFAI